MSSIEDMEIPNLEEAPTELGDLSDMGDISMDESLSDIGDISLGEDMGMSDLDLNSESLNLSDNDASLDDMLGMLDGDSELAEINDMLMKADNNEPVQDDMMDMLSQMADDEQNSLDSGFSDLFEEDEIDKIVNRDAVSMDFDDTAKTEKSKTETETVSSEENAEVEEDKKDTKKKKAKKNKKSKEADSSEEQSDEAEEKKDSKIGKFFNLLTEDLLPEPTEEELAAEKEALDAKKKEKLTKKEEEKLKKEEEKKAKAEEKEAAKKAKAEEAAKKKAENDAKKAAKKAEKEAKRAAQPRLKRIAPKKIAAAAVFGITVLAAILFSTSQMEKNENLKIVRKAYYEGDYKRVYQVSYGHGKLNESDELLVERSKVILKMKRKYDSYQNYLKMGLEVEALNALIEGLTMYDKVNYDAEMYGVSSEVDAIKSNILNTLSAKYGIDEAYARELLKNDDDLSYTKALNSIIMGNSRS